eukprot:TRINITY_DN77718_c0_g1_i1.p1 TRINITY_DN77718_c0_g1~~TRINITY_DN77718_c0_g1_i1.p1  ORF type:complete len:303 (+),score=45.17 TRINITY_DN77718_c0_g1_i1:171-1079(+)
MLRRSRSRRRRRDRDERDSGASRSVGASRTRRRQRSGGREAGSHRRRRAGSGREDDLSEENTRCRKDGEKVNAGGIWAALGEPGLDGGDDGITGVPLPMYDVNGWLRPGFAPPPPPPGSPPPEEDCLPSLEDVALPSQDELLQSPTRTQTQGASKVSATDAPLKEPTKKALQPIFLPPSTGHAGVPKRVAVESTSGPRDLLPTPATPETLKENPAKQPAPAGRDPLQGLTGAAMARLGLIPGPTVPSGSRSEGVNNKGFPMRPGVPMCSYYMRTGNCAYGFTCKWDHPDKLTTSGAAGAITL